MERAPSTRRSSASAAASAITRAISCRGTPTISGRPRSTAHGPSSMTCATAAARATGGGRGGCGVPRMPQPAELSRVLPEISSPTKSIAGLEACGAQGRAERRVVRAPSAIDAHPAPAGVRAQVLLWAAQRISAVVLAVCVLVHLATAIYAIRSGLSAAEILSRTRGSVGWAALLCACSSPRSRCTRPSDLRNVVSRADPAGAGAQPRRRDARAWRSCSRYGGWRAVYAVVAG